MAPPAPRTVPRRIGRQLADPLVALLLAAGMVTAALGDLPDTIIILLVVVGLAAVVVGRPIRRPVLAGAFTLVGIALMISMMMV